MKDRKRSVYKELKQPDEFVTFWTRVIRFVVQHKRKFVCGAVGVVLLGVLVSAWTGYSQSRERKAALLLATARASLETARAEGADPAAGGEALGELREVAGRYGRTKAGWRSRLLLGQILYEKGEYDAAAGFYEELAGGRGVPVELRTLAWEGLAYVHEQKGDFPGAAALYEKLVKDGMPYLRPWAWMALGRCYQEMGEPQRAEEAYNRFLADFPNHPMAVEARALVSRLSPAAPSEAEKPETSGAWPTPGGEPAGAVGSRGEPDSGGSVPKG